MAKRPEFRELAKAIAMQATSIFILSSSTSGRIVLVVGVAVVAAVVVVVVVGVVVIAAVGIGLLLLLLGNAPTLRPYSHTGRRAHVLLQTVHMYYYWPHTCTTTGRTHVLLAVQMYYYWPYTCTATDLTHVLQLSLRIGARRRLQPLPRSRTCEWKTSTPNG